MSCIQRQYLKFCSLTVAPKRFSLSSQFPLSLWILAVPLVLNFSWLIRSSLPFVVLLISSANVLHVLLCAAVVSFAPDAQGKKNQCKCRWETSSLFEFSKDKVERTIEVLYYI